MRWETITSCQNWQKQTFKLPGSFHLQCHLDGRQHQSQHQDGWQHQSQHQDGRQHQSQHQDDDPKSLILTPRICYSSVHHKIIRADAPAQFLIFFILKKSIFSVIWSKFVWFCLCHFCMTFILSGIHMMLNVQRYVEIKSQLSLSVNSNCQLLWNLQLKVKRLFSSFAQLFVIEIRTLLLLVFSYFHIFE